MIWIDVALGLLALAFVAGIVRAAIGPTLADRAVAADVCLFTVVAALALMAVRFDSPLFLDAVLVSTLLGFVATISLSRLIERGRE